MSMHRRSFLTMSGSVLAVAMTSALWPLRAMAQWARSDAAFDAKGIDAAFAAFGGVPEPSTEITFTAPEIAENGAVVPVSVTSKIPGTEQIAIFVEKNPNPLAGVFIFPEGTEAAVQTRVKVGQTCKLYAVVRAKGKLYVTSRETKVTLGGCGG